MRKLSIAIPVFNSQKTIEQLVDSIILGITNFDLEIILVNDGSKDNSEKKCVSLFYKYPQTIKFYSLSKNFGEHNAVMAALNHASGDYTIIIDDDFQNHVSEIIKLADFAFSNNFDVIYSKYSKKQHNFFRNLGGKFNNLVASWLLSKPKKLYLNSFKAINKFIVDEIIKYNLPYPYIDGLILRTTTNIGQIEVKHFTRKTGKSQYTLIKLISLWLNMLTNFSVKPLRFATLLGFFFSIISFMLAIAGVLMKLYDPTVPLGYASLLVSISFLGGIQLIAIGMVGEYVGRTFLSINKSPQFVIKKKYEST